MIYPQLSRPQGAKHAIPRPDRRPLDHNGPLILNEPGIHSAPYTHRVFATAWRTEQQPSDANYRLHEVVDLDVCLVNNGQPLTDRIAALVKAKLGPEWQCSWWMTEPLEDLPF